jgi:hypothetical protein
MLNLEFQKKKQFLTQLIIRLFSKIQLWKIKTEQFYLISNLLYSFILRFKTVFKIKGRVYWNVMLALEIQLLQYKAAF